METLVILFLLAYAEKDGDFKKDLRRVLEFYRENRQLILALVTEKGMTSDKIEDTATKNAPSDRGEGMLAFEELLKKL